MSTPVAVLGAGSWGTALAVLLARNGVPTTLWGRSPQAVVDMASARTNARYLPEMRFPDALGISGTPTFFINGRIIGGVRPYIEYRQVIESFLK